jgi:hypothetical protein
VPVNSVTNPDGSVTVTETDAQGNVQWTSTAVPPTAQVVAQTTIQQRITSGLSVLEADVATLAGGAATPVQKDAALLHVVRAAARLSRLALAQFDQAGA